MRPGPARGETATLEVVVTDDMAATIDGERIHPVLGTVALVGLMEQVCRRLLVPHLEPGEEGVGAFIEANHRAPVPVGATIVLTASVAQVGPRQLVCEVLVRQGSALVARGSFTQAVVSASDFAAEVASRRSALQG